MQVSNFTPCDELSINLGECGGLGVCSGVAATLAREDSTLGQCVCQPGMRGAVDFITRVDLYCDVNDIAIQVLWALVLVSALCVTVVVVSKASFLIYVLAARTGTAYGFNMRSPKSSCISFACRTRPGQVCPFIAVVILRFITDKIGQVFILEFISAICFSIVSVIKVTDPSAGIATPNAPALTVFFSLACASFWSLALLFLFRWVVVAFAAPMLRSAPSGANAAAVFESIVVTFRVTAAGTLLSLTTSTLLGLLPDLSPEGQFALLAVHLQGTASSMLFFAIWTVAIKGAGLIRAMDATIAFESSHVATLKGGRSARLSRAQQATAAYLNSDSREEEEGEGSSHGRIADQESSCSRRNVRLCMGECCYELRLLLIGDPSDSDSSIQIGDDSSSTAFRADSAVTASPRLYHSNATMLGGSLATAQEATATPHSDACASGDTSSGRGRRVDDSVPNDTPSSASTGRYLNSTNDGDDNDGDDGGGSRVAVTVAASTVHLHHHSHSNHDRGNSDGGPVGAATARAVVNDQATSTGVIGASLPDSSHEDSRTNIPPRPREPVPTLQMLGSAQGTSGRVASSAISRPIARSAQGDASRHIDSVSRGGAVSRPAGLDPISMSSRLQDMLGWAEEHQLSSDTRDDDDMVTVMESPSISRPSRSGRGSADLERSAYEDNGGGSGSTGRDEGPQSPATEESTPPHLHRHATESALPRGRTAAGARAGVGGRVRSSLMNNPSGHASSATVHAASTPELLGGTLRHPTGRAAPIRDPIDVHASDIRAYALRTALRATRLVMAGRSTLLATPTGSSLAIANGPHRFGTHSGDSFYVSQPASARSTGPAIIHGASSVPESTSQSNAHRDAEPGVVSRVRALSPSERGQLLAMLRSGGAGVSARGLREGERRLQRLDDRRRGVTAGGGGERGGSQRTGRAAGLVSLPHVSHVTSGETGESISDTGAITRASAGGIALSIHADRYTSTTATVSSKHDTHSQPVSPVAQTVEQTPQPPSSSSPPSADTDTGAVAVAVAHAEVPSSSSPQSWCRLIDVPGAAVIGPVRWAARHRPRSCSDSVLAALGTATTTVSATTCPLSRALPAEPTVTRHSGDDEDDVTRHASSLSDTGQLPRPDAPCRKPAMRPRHRAISDVTPQLHHLDRNPPHETPHTGIGGRRIVAKGPLSRAALPGSDGAELDVTAAAGAAGVSVDAGREGSDSAVNWEEGRHHQAARRILSQASSRRISMSPISRRSGLGSTPLSGTMSQSQSPKPSRISPIDRPPAHPTSLSPDHTHMSARRAPVTRPQSDVPSSAIHSTSAMDVPSSASPSSPPAAPSNHHHHDPHPSPHTLDESDLPVHYIMAEGLEHVDPAVALAREDVVVVDVTAALQAHNGSGRTRGGGEGFIGADVDGGGTGNSEGQHRQAPDSKQAASTGHGQPITRNMSRAVVVMHTGVLRSRRQRLKLQRSLARFKKMRQSLFSNFLMQAALMMSFLYWDFLRSKMDYELPVSWLSGHVLALYIILTMKIPIPRHVEHPLRGNRVSGHTVGSSVLRSRGADGVRMGGSSGRHSSEATHASAGTDTGLQGAPVCRCCPVGCKAACEDSGVGKRARASVILCCWCFTADPRLIAAVRAISRDDEAED